MKPYPTYKDSGIAWIGQIPSHWKEARLKRKVKLINDKTDDPKQQYIGLENVESFTGIIKNIGSTIPDSICNAFKTGDILFCKLRPYLTKCVLTNFDGKCTSELLVLRDFEGLNRFLHYLLLSHKCIGYINASTYGSKMPRANWQFIGNVEIPIPPVDEQEAIVRFITEKSEKIDRYIAEQERLLAALDELRAAEIARAVTRGLNPDAPLRDSGINWIGQIPEHWDVNRIKVHFYHISGNGFKIEFQGQTRGDFPFCKASDINGRDREVNTAANYVSKDLALQEGYNIIPRGSLLFAKIGEALKKNHRKINTCDCIVDNNCSALVQKADSNINMIYFFYISMLLDMATFDNGGTIPCVNISKLLSCQIPHPPHSEQRAIVEYLDAKTAKIDRMKADIEKLICYMKEYKQRMISDAVTGKIDVRE